MDPVVVDPAVPPRAGFDQGMAALVVAVCVFSTGSTLVKWSDTPGPVVAVWRMLLASVAWWLVIVLRWAKTGRRPPTAATWRAVAPVGVFFGINLSVFFTAVNHTSVAHAEFINALSPLLLVPLGAIVFGERVRGRALPFGLVSLAGLAIVLFSGQAHSAARWQGDLLVAICLLSWCCYLVVGRKALGKVDTVDFMATMMPVGFLVAAPNGFIQSGGAVWSLEAKGWVAILLLCLLTGMIGHGLIAFGQSRVEVGTIAVVQVAQPAIAVVWAMLLLGEEVSLRQVPGMVLVLAGLAGFTLVQTRGARRHPTPAAPRRLPVTPTPTVCPATD